MIAIDDGADDDADRADGVGEHLEAGALVVERLLGALAQQGERDQVASRPSTATTSIGPASDVDRVAEPAQRLDEHVDAAPSCSTELASDGQDLQRW